MKLYELIEYLKWFDDDLEVRIAYQPNWPLCSRVASVKKQEGCLYICESGYGGNGYAPGGLFETDECVDLDDDEPEEDKWAN